MEPEKKTNGAMVGLIIIIIILIVGGIYIWQTKVQNTLEENNSTNSISTSDSAELDTLQTDLDGADTNAGVDVNSVQ